MTDDVSGGRTAADLLRQVRALEDELAVLRRRVATSPDRVHALESRLTALQTSLEATATQNERLVRTLKEAREQIVTLKSEVDRLAQPPSGFGTIVEVGDEGTVDVLTGGRKMRVAVSPAVEPADLAPGREVLLNEALNVVLVRGFERVGEVVQLKEILGEDRVLVVGHNILK